MSSARYIVRGGRIVTPSGTVTGSVLIEDGRIGGVGDIPEEDAGQAEVIDARGRLILPGLIDLHVQGAGGSDLLSDDPEAVLKVAANLASFGTTAFLATTVLDTTRDDQPHIRSIVDSVGERPGCASVLGIHLEGPFISPDKKGMIQKEHIREASRDYYEWIKDICGGHLRMMTIAPEVPGALGIIEDMAGCGMIAALGHTNATYDETLKGIAAGLSHVTHTGNAMRSLHHREPGAFGAVLMSDALTMQIIADGIHLHPAVLAWLIGMKGPDRFAVITDAIGAMGMPPGEYSYGDVGYTIQDGACRYSDGTLIGTALTQPQMVRRLMGFSDLPLHEAVNMASLYPARIVGVSDRKGTIEEGKDADLVICDRELSVETVFVQGEPAARWGGRSGE